MLHATPLHTGPLAAVAYRCDAGPQARPYAEQHLAWSAAYVERGSFGCRCGGRHHELVPGAVLLGRPGDEYTCTHEHAAGGDACLAFFVEPALADELGARPGRWTSGALPALPSLIALGERARHAAGIAGGGGPSLDEIGLHFVAEVAALLGGRRREPLAPGAADRRRAVQSALWIDLHSHQRLDLSCLAQQAGLSMFHYLRVFAAVLGVTPHQYLLRTRLRHAAWRLLHGDESITEVALATGFEDLSNFVRSFGRLAGLPPRRYRQAVRGMPGVAATHRKICQDTRHRRS